jgi:hypothetical protein
MRRYYCYAKRVPAWGATLVCAQLDVRAAAPRYTAAPFLRRRCVSARLSKDAFQQRTALLLGS